MAEKSQVFDILHPSPVSLKKLAVMAVSVEVWRCEMNKLRTSDTLEQFWPSCESISPKTILPDLPSAIANVIEEYVKKFASSVRNWLDVHYTKVFRFHHDSKTYILKKFDDFVCDYDGTVHHEKTAKRMMDSDRLSQSEKFKIACTHFFEDDIRRLWPSVCERMNLNNVDFNRNPELYYWICCLRDELEKIPVLFVDDGSVDETITMLYRCIPNNTSSKHSVLYFWDRIPLESRMQTAVNCFYVCKASFVRFILPKLDHDQLAEFVNANGVELIDSLLNDPAYNEIFVLSTWMYIRNIMTIMSLSQITDLVVKMLQEEGKCCEDRGISSRKLENWLYLCFVILDNLPRDLKLSMIRTVLSNNNNTLVESLSICWGRWRTVEFLLIILTWVTFKERNVFFHTYWHLLIPHMRCKDMKRLVAICFENEDEIAQFKENTMNGNTIVRDICAWLLIQCFFDELSEFVSFCYPDIGKARGFKQELLQSALLDEDHPLTSYTSIINSPKELSQFIDDVYQNADLSADFKNQLMFSPIFLHRLSLIICSRELHRMKPIEFFEIFVSSEQTMQQIKTRLIDAFKEILNVNTTSLGDYVTYMSVFKECLVWCLGGVEEFTKFEDLLASNSSLKWQ